MKVTKKLTGYLFAALASFLVLMFVKMPVEAAEWTSPDGTYTLEYDFVEDSGESELVITGYTGAPVNLEFPAVIDGKPVVAVGNDAFEDCNTLNRVVFPEGMRLIGITAFFNTSLTEIEWSSTVETLEYGAFALSAIKSLYIPPTLKEIRFGAFSDTPLEELVFDIDADYSGMSEIRGEAFSYTNLTKLVLPNAPFLDHSFGYNDKLSTVVFPANISTKNYGWLFTECLNMDAIYITPGMEIDDITKILPTYYAPDYVERGRKIKVYGPKEYEAMAQAEIAAKGPYIEYIVIDEEESEESLIFGSIRFMNDEYMYYNQVCVSAQYEIVQSAETMSDKVLRIGIPKGFALVEGSVYKGQQNVEYTIDNSTICVPLADDEDFGRITFYLTATGEEVDTIYVDSYLKMTYTNSENSSEEITLAYLQAEYEPVIITSGNQTTDESSVIISGRALAGEAVEIYVNDVLFKTVTSNAVNGKFDAEIFIGSEDIYAVKAVLVGTEYEDECTIVKFEANEVVSVNVTVNEGEKVTPFDMTDGEEYIYTVVYPDELSMDYEVTFADNNAISEVFIYGYDLDGKKVSVPFVYDDAKDAFVAKGTNINTSNFYIEYSLKDGSEPVIEAIGNVIRWAPDGFCTLIIDPSGYVYEGVTTNRLEGVTATAYWIPWDMEDEDFFETAPTTEVTGELWNAEDCDQVNPVISNEVGYYGWDVPMGWWRVQYEKEGYRTTYSEWMPVHPPQLDVNIGMEKIAAANVEKVTVEGNTVKVLFDQYMDPMSMSGVKFYDTDGQQIYGEYTYSEEEHNADDVVFAKEFVFILESDDIARVSVTTDVWNHASRSVTAYEETFGEAEKPADWGDVTEEDRAEFATPDDVPVGLWIAGAKDVKKVYTGSNITLDFRVYDHLTLLEEKTDYTVKYANNKNAAKADAKKAPKVTIVAKGDYKGTESICFTILQASIEGEDLSMAEAVTGKVLKPVPVLNVNGKELKNKTDYTVSYGVDAEGKAIAGFKDAGEYTITLTGKGNYTGERTVKYELKAATKVSSLKISSVKAQTYTGEEIKPEVKVTKGGTELAKGTDYSVDYKDNVNVGTASITITGHGDYVGSKTITFKINPIATMNKTTITLSGKSVEYTGYAHGIGVGENPLTAKVEYDGEELVLGTDYSISDYKNNINVGTATVTFKGMGGYSGTVKKTFKITAADITKADILLSDENGNALENNTCAYEKGGSKPVVIAGYNGNELVAGTDYTVSYRNNTKLGTATVTIKGKKDFKGSTTMEFIVAKQDLSNLSISAKDIVYKKKANIYKSKVTILDANGKALKAGTDYEKALVYSYAEDCVVTLTGKKAESAERKKGDVVGAKDIIPAGVTIDVTAKGMKNYEGELQTDFRFVEADIAKASVKVADQIYTGSEICPDASAITVKIGGKELSAEDYEIVSYSNNISKGTATVTIKGVGNYGGTKTVKFKIKEKAFSFIGFFSIFG